MNNLVKKIILAVFITSFISLQLLAQKDTTELEIGKRKLIIIDKKTQKENAIYNLEKGKETFEKEISEAKKEIERQKILIEKQKVELNKLLAKLEKDKELKIYSQGKEDKKTEDDLKIEKDKIEIEKNKLAIEKHKKIIELNNKKINAFENGLSEIEKGITEIEKGLNNIDKELNDISNSNVTPVFNEKSNKRRFNAHWAGFEFGLLNFVNKKQSFVNDQESSFMKVVPEKTFSYGLNIFELNIPFTKYSLGLATGAGFRWNSLSLEKDVNLTVTDNKLIAEVIDANIEELRKNKLNVAYVKIPLVIEYQTSIKSRKLYFSAGLFGELRAWSKQKQIYIIDGVKHKGKKVDDFQLSPFRYGVSARAGYGDIGIFIEYVLTPLFKDDSAAPEMYPVMIGIRLVDF